MKCTTENYDLLYSRYLKNPGHLLDLGKYNPKRDRLLDLAGGTGIVSKTALTRGGQDIELVDIAPRIKDPLLTIHQQDCGEFLLGPNRRYSLIVCRQAINYMNLRNVFIGAWKSLFPDGRFVFNTFSKPKRMKYMSYDIGEKKYRELSIFLFGRIFHWQILRKPKFMMDFTVFKYYDSDYLIDQLLEAGFNKVAKVNKNKSVYLIASKE